MHRSWHRAYSFSCEGAGIRHHPWRTYHRYGYAKKQGVYRLFLPLRQVMEMEGIGCARGQLKEVEEGR